MTEYIAVNLALIEQDDDQKGTIKFKPVRWLKS